MRAFRLASGRRIAPFGDPVRELHVATQTIDQWQREACRGAGLELTDVTQLGEISAAPAIVFWDDVFFTEMALRQLVADGPSLKHDVALAFPESPLTRALAPLSDARVEAGATAFDLFWLTAPPSASEDRARLRERVRPHLVATRERALPVRLPKSDAAEGAIDAPLTTRIVSHVTHWLHILRLSQLSIGGLLLERVRRDPWRILALRWAARRGGPWAAARKLVFVHPTARVHPTADLEAAIIGPECVVRAHAHVHSSVLGRGVDVGDHAAIVGCALADQVQVLRGSYLALCAAMPGGTLSSSKVQLSLFGRDVFLTWSALLADAKLQGQVRVEHDGAFVPIGTSFLGGCLGHGVRLGAQVLVAPGRAVPNGVILLGPPGQVAERFPSSAPGLYVVQDGTVIPLGDQESELLGRLTDPHLDAAMKSSARD